MYITNDDFKAIENALNLLPQGDEFKNLPESEQDIIVKATVVMVNLLKKQKADNKRTATYIADRRKYNKNYARPKKRR